MRKMREDEIRKIADNCLDQVRSVDWNAKGRVDFVMASKLRDLNASLKELKRRKVIGNYRINCTRGEGFEPSLSFEKQLSRLPPYRWAIPAQLLYLS